MFDAEGRILLFNERYSEMMDRTDVPLQGRLLRDVLHEQKAVGKWDGDPDEFFNMVLAAAKAGESLTRVVSRNGRSIRVVDQPKKGGGWVATFEDITEWQLAQEQITHMARHDALTNLPNRMLFRERMEKACGWPAQSDQVAVLCLDLDHFKDVNDTLGHPVGDALLKAVARGSACVPRHDIVARLGGDEFVVVQFCIDCDPSAASVLASHIVERIGAPFDIGGHQLIVGVSIGIAVAPETAGTARPAEECRHRALPGQGRRPRHLSFLRARHGCAPAGAALLELRSARGARARRVRGCTTSRSVDTAATASSAFEALVRWNHPSGA